MTDHDPGKEGPQVPDMLKALAGIYRQRGSLYADNYLHFGKAMMAFFPRGLNLHTADDFNRFHLFVLMGSKLSRYAMMLTAGGHVDSLDDLSVYSQMLQQFDSLARARPVGTRDTPSLVPRKSLARSRHSKGRRR